LSYFTFFSSLFMSHVGVVPAGSRNNAVLYVICTHFFLFHYADAIHSQLLIAISSALPFLGIRVLYSVLSSYSGSPIPNAESSTNSSLSKFNIINGDWRIYLVMGLIMEYVVVLVYTTAGSRIPLQDDYSDDELLSSKEPVPLMQTERLQNRQVAYPLQAYAVPSFTGHDEA
jgi:hypothetical protein